MDYLVSIIVPIYNVERYVERCVRALFEQTFSSLEYVFVDDCTPDHSLEMIECIATCYPHRAAAVQFVHHSENRGVSAARNSGLLAANGDYIIFCDGDDWMEFYAIEKMYGVAIDSGADVVWSDFYYTYSDHEVLSIQKNKEIGTECIRALLCEKMHGGLWNKLVKRDLYDRYNIDFQAGLNIWEDLRVSVQLFFYARSVAYFPQATYHYIQYNSDSLCVSRVFTGLRDTIGNADGIIYFLAQNGIRWKFEKQVNFLKLAAKKNLLTTTNRYTFMRWRLVYPEANRYILSYRSLPLRLRLIGWCAAHGVWVVIHFWILLKKKL